MKNSGVKIHYLYRDQSNFKLFDSEDFTNYQNISICKIDTILQRKLIDGEFFYPMVRIRKN